MKLNRSNKRQYPVHKVSRGARGMFWTVRTLLPAVIVACLTLGPSHNFTSPLIDRAMAQGASSLESNILGQLTPTDEETPLLLQADEVTYDNRNNRVVARGNVEIYYNQYTLLADAVVYDQRVNTLTAEGNVRIKEPDGAIVNADRITLTDDFREGFIRSLRIVTADESRIAARSAQRIEGNTTVFEQGVFTPCKPCEDNPEKPPLWRIKAAKVIHDKNAGNISYEDASLEIFGVPVAYIPFFEHPDPTVKRKSGFLFPRVGQSSDLGFTVETPYFFNLAPNFDFTFSPKVTTKQGLLARGEWRHRLKNGIYTVEVAAIEELDPDETVGVEDSFRGSIKSKGSFRLGSWWNWGWDITAETDETFRRFYKLDNIVTSDRVSKVYVIGQNERNYFEGNLYHFGGLVANDDSISNSLVHPVIDYNYIFGSPILGGELSFNSNVLSLSRDDGVDTNRLIAEVRWRRTLIDGLGQVYEPFFSARGDVYQVSDFAGTNDDTITRGVATAGLTYSYPFVARSRNSSHIIEPVAQVLARPDIDEQTTVPNEDAQSLVFDDTLLFDTDKFSGLDRIETGVRANVGVRYTVQMDNGGYARIIVGRSYHLAGDNAYLNDAAFVDSGLETDDSDYVSGLYLEPNEHFTLIAQQRFDDDDFNLERTDVYASTNYGPFKAAVNYANIEAQPSLGFTDDREEILGSGSIQITDRWSIFGSARYDIEAEQFISDSVGAKYSDECFLISLTYTETFIRDTDIQPDESVMLRVEFKHLGGFATSTGNVGDLIANPEDQ